MVTVVKTPTGHKIIDQAVSATIIDSSGDALITFPYHSLTTGDYVYITSDIDEYNGFWYVTGIDANTFKISDGVSDFVEFYQEIDIEYYQTQSHDWSSVFLPIIYKISNDRWPVNSVDAVGLIVLNSDDNGFTTLTLAAPLAGLNAALEFVKITGATEEANGVWQVVEIIVSNVITINLPYEFSGNLIGKDVQYYYNNYQVRVKVFAGLDPTHPWEPKKPYEEMAELSLTPDENNEVMFSVSDYIKSKVAIKNNITLFSLPLNLDAFTGFYISTGESYDSSDNYSLYTTESSFVDDDFEGYAIAGKLPFKNIYAGDYADYVYTSGSPAKWLTNRERLLAVEDYYFDISFIKNITGDFILRINKYVTDYLSATEDVLYTDQGIGVYRIPITPDANYDSFCIQIGLLSGETLDNSEFQNDGGSGTAWTTGANPNVTRSVIGSSEILYVDYAFIAGTSYVVTINYSVVGSSTGSVTLEILDSVFGVEFLNSEPLNSSTQNILSFTATSSSEKIGIVGTWLSNFLSTTITLNSVIIEMDNLALTEEICIDILDTCEAAEGFTEEDRRLLEDGDFRLLE